MYISLAYPHAGSKLYEITEIGYKSVVLLFLLALMFVGYSGLHVPHATGHIFLTPSSGQY